MRRLLGDGADAADLRALEDLVSHLATVPDGAWAGRRKRRGRDREQHQARGRPGGRGRPRSRPKIVFVGGTGRSGTHVLGELIGHHRRYALVPIESRFHVNPQGFPGPARRRGDAEQFVDKLRRFWWWRIPAGQPLPALAPGLALGARRAASTRRCPRTASRRAVARFEAARRTASRWTLACRRLFLDLLWPIADEAGKPRLVEMSTHNVAHAPELARLFPDAKLVHIVRDGRDAGSSKVGKRQKDAPPARRRRGRRLVARAASSGRSARSPRPPTSFALTLSLDELAAGDRDARVRAPPGFLGIPRGAEMRRFLRPPHERRELQPRPLAGGPRRSATSRRSPHAYERAIERLEGQRTIRAARRCAASTSVSGAPRR